ncbi:PLP-dependent aminotransferase family protein [Dongia soli]|uniref:PLP-dependent aminotransferase family protein n=1 Tax=Dongia soli TaxID=600628 RepID=A0ABU5EGA1_9PROT|nr:PLP-dependent aminotransferase family protein [Dongia soli]MDY0885267.1 PLP-dependent aminotransferase family protein [Dongia soli]
MTEIAISWTPDIDKSAGPVYLAIADALSADIQAGRLAGGTRLPPQRTLAEVLGIDFTTVSRAYTEARRRGLVEGKVGQGTYVRSKRPLLNGAVPSGLVDMSMNMPPRFDDSGLTTRMWRSVNELEADGGLDLLLRYQEPGGTGRDRAAGVSWLSSRLDGLFTDRVLVCPGAQGALLALAGALATPGDTICTEPLTYPGFLSLAAHLRLQLVSVASDADGPIPEAFDKVCIERRPKAFYCNPTIQNPTTLTIPLKRRQALAAIARHHHVPIIEDDAYGALPTAPVAPFAAIAPDIVYHVAGLAKCLAPALRIAYLVVPDSRSAIRLAGAIRATASMASPVTASIATRWIEDGTADAVLAAIRNEAAARQVLATHILPADMLRIDPEGFHLWLNLPQPWTRGEFVARLRSIGIGVVTSDAFALASPPEAVRVGLGAPASRAELEQGLRAMADLLAQPPAMSSLVI